MDRSLSVCCLVILVLAAGCAARRSTVGGTGPFAVSGRVLGPDGTPLAKQRVTVGAQSTVTASDGSFQLLDVTAPYDAMVGEKYPPFILYVGLTRVDPQLWVPSPGMGIDPFGPSGTPPPPHLLSPAPLASVDATTPFAWTIPNGAKVFTFFVQPVVYEGVADSGCCEQGYAGPSADSFEIVTSAHTLTLSAFPASALSELSSGPEYWGVRAYSDRASVDDAAGALPVDWACRGQPQADVGAPTCAWEFQKFVW